MKQQDAQLTLRPSGERGYFDHGWLKTYHSFSFGDYHDPRYMGFRSLRVINEDFVDGAMGFGKHPHKDMEIFTYVLQGALEHKDSMGNSSVIHSGDVQKMTAGTGVFHSEFNHSPDDKVHLLQIWILPQEKGLAPSYQQFALMAVDPQDPFQLIGSPQGGTGIMQFHQDVYIYRGLMTADQRQVFTLKSGRALWIQVIQGAVLVSGQNLGPGDGLGIEHTSDIQFKGVNSSEFLIFDLK
jgi:redox-sensitive bicupin YhaK (pirin superfamily)